jgi:hypothetical protein
VVAACGPSSTPSSRPAQEPRSPSAPTFSVTPAA